MAEYIEREATLQFVFEACSECMDACEEFDGINPDCHQCMIEGIKLKLRDIPTADVVPVRHGRWKPMDLTYGRSFYYCSVCEQTENVATAMGVPMFTYCPNCGAKMDGEA